MSKKVKFSYILSLIVFGICIAWNTLSRFFSGVGLNYVALLGILSVLTFWFVEDKEIKHRVLEIFIAVCAITALETICFIFFEMSTCASYNVYMGFETFQNVLSILSIFLFVYTMVRFLLDVKKVKVHFIEVMLGNEKRAKKQKVEKQISNGSLGKKPNSAKASEAEKASSTAKKPAKPSVKEGKVEEAKAEKPTSSKGEEDVEEEIIPQEQIIVEEPTDEE